MIGQINAACLEVCASVVLCFRKLLSDFVLNLAEINAHARVFALLALCHGCALLLLLPLLLLAVQHVGDDCGEAALVQACFRVVLSTLSGGAGCKNSTRRMLRDGRRLYRNSSARTPDRLEAPSIERSTGVNRTHTDTQALFNTVKPPLSTAQLLMTKPAVTSAVGHDSATARPITFWATCLRVLDGMHKALSLSSLWSRGHGMIPVDQGTPAGLTYVYTVRVNSSISTHMMHLKLQNPNTMRAKSPYTPSLCRGNSLGLTALPGPHMLYLLLNSAQCLSYSCLQFGQLGQGST